MILVTGGTGMLGSHLIPGLLLRGEKVRVLIREGSDYMRILPIWKFYYPNAEELIKKVEWFRGDLINKASVEEAMEGVDRVFHCGALVSFDPSRLHAMYNANVLGTRNIVDSCLQNNVKKLLHVSSIAAIGPGQEGEILTEENRWLINPKAAYPLTKTLAEQEVWRGIIEGLNAVIINPSVIIGAGIPGQSSTSVFTTVKNGLKFYTNGVTGFVDVNDVVKAMIVLMESETSGERFVINGFNASFKELFGKIAKEFGIKAPGWHASPFLTSVAWKVIWVWSKISGKPPVITKESARSAHKIQQYSSEKLNKLTGFKFAEMDESIANICRFYKKQVLITP